MSRHHLAIYQRYECAVAVLPDLADAPFTVLDHAAVMTQITLDMLVRQAVEKIGFHVFSRVLGVRLVLITYYVIYQNICMFLKCF